MKENRTEQGWWNTLPQDWTAPLRGKDGTEIEVPLREHPALRKYASKDEAVKALVHAQRLVGRKPEGYVRVPGPEAEPEERNAFRSALGLPKRPEEYGLPELDLPEGFEVDGKLQGEFLQVAHELGLTPEQVHGLYAWFLPRNVETVRAMEQDREDRRGKELESLRGLHRGDTRAVLEAARRAALTLGGEELLAVLDETGAADRAVVVSALSRLAPVLLEGRFRFRDAGAARTITPEKLKEMMRDPRYHDPLQRDPAFVDKVAKGFATLYPGKYEPGTRV